MTLEQNLERRNAMLTDVLSHLEQYLNDTGGCDHSVNICVCELRNTLDDFGVYCHDLTGGMVGWPNLRFDVTERDDTDTFNMYDFARELLTESNASRLAQLKAEADASNAAFRKGTINDVSHRSHLQTRTDD